MKRFSYSTGTVPDTSGEGVAWPDGSVTVREVTNGLQGDAINGSIQDITNQYGGQQNYVFTWIDP